MQRGTCGHAAQWPTRPRFYAAAASAATTAAAAAAAKVNFKLNFNFKFSEIFSCQLIVEIS